jgi:hypothetical protein
VPLTNLFDTSGINRLHDDPRCDAIQTGLVTTNNVWIFGSSKIAKHYDWLYGGDCAMTLIILIILALLIGVFLYWYLILRHGRMSFWKLAARNPDAAYHHIRSASCWKIFEGELPKNYRSIVPKSEWAGPFKLRVPKLGGKTIVVFGRHPEFEKSQNKFIRTIGEKR